MTTIGTIPCFHPHTGSPATGKYEACFRRFLQAHAASAKNRQSCQAAEPRQPQAGTMMKSCLARSLDHLSAASKVEIKQYPEILVRWRLRFRDPLS